MDAYFLVIAVITVILCLVIITVVHGAVNRKKLAAILRREYGKAPDLRYEEGDIEQIGEYYLYRLAHGTGEFKIDEITWNDLNMDGLFVDMNGTQTSCGEQILYDTLRTPAFDKETFDRRRHIADTLDKNEELRLKLQLIFAALGRRRRINICEEFEPSKRSSVKAVLYCVLAALFILLFVYTAILPMNGAPFLFLSFVINFIVYMYNKRKVDDDLTRLNYALGMISAAKAVEKLAAPEIADYIEPLVQADKKIGSLSTLGAVTLGQSTGDLQEILSNVILWELIKFEISRCKIGGHYKELMTIFEIIGGLDCAVSVASYRRRQNVLCCPEIDFNSREAFVNACGLVHPLIKNAVPNDFDTHSSILLTGSNASGKSTYLKTIAINAIFAQTVCVCFAQSYRASALRVYSSMALKDDIAAGESYYIVEIKSIGRMIEAAGHGTPVLCIVDEVLRGTNTVERIAASSEILSYIASHGALCVAATHDIELASILGGIFKNYHFQEYIENNAMSFDYKLHDGPSTSRNAIKLLEIMGYDKEISDNASISAERFLKSGVWGNVQTKLQ